MQRRQILYIVGRERAFIKARGWSVAPAKIEAVLLLPNVLGAAVVGVPDEEHTGELARACIIRRLATNRDKLEDEVLAEDLRRFDATMLAWYKRLDSGVFFVDEIPQNTISKMVKGRLIALQEHHSLLAAWL